MGSQAQKNEVIVALPADEWAKVLEWVSDWLMGRGIEPPARYCVYVFSLDRPDEIRVVFERIAVDRARCVQIPSLVVIAR